MTDGAFKAKLSMVDMVFVGFGAIFGSGWLFASSKVGSIAGPAGTISWVIGGIAVLLLGLVYAELGASLPRAGGVIRYPLYSHGPLLGYLMAFETLVAFSSLIAIEVVAAREYAAAWMPWLNGEGSSPSLIGWFAQLAILVVFMFLNYRAVTTFAESNFLITIFKFLVPILTIVVLLAHLKPGNFTAHEFAPFGASGIMNAVSAGGVMFAFLGLQPIVSMASEARNPKRDVPLALVLSVLLGTVVYVLLQVSFIGAIPDSDLANGWAHIDSLYSLPYRDVATVLGLGWLTYFIVSDAIISPAGTGNIYMSASPRVVYGWARSGTFFRVFTRVDEKSGVPRPALWLTFAMSVFWTLPFPSWGVLVNVVSAALILSYAIAPICAGSFRRQAPQLARPFRVGGFSIISPAAFVIAAFIVYWTGWATVSWLLASQIVLFVIYLAVREKVPQDLVSLPQQVRSSVWLIVFYIAMLVVSYLGSYGGGQGVLAMPLDMILVTGIALGSYYWGVHSALPAGQFDEDPVVGDDDLAIMEGRLGDDVGPIADRAEHAN